MCETKQIWIGTKYPLDAEHEILIFQNGTPSGEGNAEGTLESNHKIKIPASVDNRDRPNGDRGYQPKPSTSIGIEI